MGSGFGLGLGLGIDPNPKHIRGLADGATLPALEAALEHMSAAAERLRAAMKSAHTITQISVDCLVGSAAMPFPVPASPPRREATRRGILSCDV